MSFNYLQLTTDLFDAGGRPVPIDNKPPQLLKDWAVAEGATLSASDTSLILVQKIATARGVAYLPGDDHLKLLKKIAVSSPERGPSMLAQEIIAESSLPFFTPAPVLTLASSSELGWNVRPSTSIGVIEIARSGNGVSWQAPETAVFDEAPYAVSQNYYYRARWVDVEAGTNRSGWSNIVFLP